MNGFMFPRTDSDIIQILRSELIDLRAQYKVAGHRARSVLGACIAANERKLFLLENPTVCIGHFGGAQ